MILFEKKYQTFDTVFHHQMKHLEVRQKYSAARRIFNSLLGVSSGDETLHLMFDILLKKPENGNRHKQSAQYNHWTNRKTMNDTLEYNQFIVEIQHWLNLWHKPDQVSRAN